MDDLATRVAVGEIDLSDAQEQLDVLIAAPDLYSPLVTVLAYGLSAGVSAVSFFGAGWIDALISFLLGCIVGAAMFLDALIPSVGQVGAIPSMPNRLWPPSLLPSPRSSFNRPPSGSGSPSTVSGKEGAAG